MLKRRIVLSFLAFAITQKSLIPLTSDIPANSLQNKTAVTWSQVCSCRSYYGIPHTCYYSSATDPYNSCYSKCVREANR